MKNKGKYEYMYIHITVYKILFLWTNLKCIKSLISLITINISLNIKLGLYIFYYIYLVLSFYQSKMFVWVKVCINDYLDWKCIKIGPWLKLLFNVTLTSAKHLIPKPIKWGINQGGIYGETKIFYKVEINWRKKIMLRILYSH